MLTDYVMFRDGIRQSTLMRHHGARRRQHPNFPMSDSKSWIEQHQSSPSLGADNSNFSKRTSHGPGGDVFANEPLQGYHPLGRGSHIKNDSHSRPREQLFEVNRWTRDHQLISSCVRPKRDRPLALP